jgi:hypothetical protein
MGMRMASDLIGVINVTEAYSKAVVVQRLGISQRFWDQMLDGGLPYTNIGHSRWVTGQALMDYITKHSETKSNGTAAENT